MRTAFAGDMAAVIDREIGCFCAAGKTGGATQFPAVTILFDAHSHFAPPGGQRQVGHRGRRLQRHIAQQLHLNAQAMIFDLLGDLAL